LGNFVERGCKNWDEDEEGGRNSVGMNLLGNSRRRVRIVWNQLEFGCNR
jgi:hypothetical protein